MEFVLAARFTSDSIESLFSIMRSISGPKANALKMCQVIKLLIASDLLNSNIESFNDDEAVNYRIVDSNISVNSVFVANDSISPVLTPSENAPPNQTEREALFYIAGAIARYIYNLSKPLYIRKTKPIILCSKCEQLLNKKHSTAQSVNALSKNTMLNLNSENYNLDYRFTEIVNRGGLIFVSTEIFNYILNIEAILPKFILTDFKSDNFLNSICKKISSEIFHTLPNCCNLPDLILSRKVLILTHRYLHSLFNRNQSSDLISGDMSTSSTRFT